MPGTYPASGGFTGGTVAGATTFSSDVTFNGGTGAIGLGAGDTIVPADGTLNVTGAVLVAGALSTSGGQDISSAGNVTATGGNLFTAANARVSALTGQTNIASSVADGASAIAVRIIAMNDLVTAGAKIASFGDNATTAYAEKAYIDYLGALTLNGRLTAPNAQFTQDVIFQNAGGATPFNISDPSGNVLVSIYDTGTVGRLHSTGSLSIGGVTAIKTTDYVATVADFLIPVDVATTGDVAITLPAANAAKGQILTVKATSLHVTRDININRAGADTITTYAAAGATTLQLSPTATLSQVTLVSDGTSIWYVTNLNA